MGGWGQASECAASFLERGFLLLDGVLLGAELAAAQAAFHAAQAPERPLWEAAVAAMEEAPRSVTAPGGYAARYFDLPRALECDPSFFAIAAHSRIVEILQLVRPRADAPCVPTAAGGETG